MIPLHRAAPKATLFFAPTEQPQREKTVWEVVSDQVDAPRVPHSPVLVQVEPAASKPVKATARGDLVEVAPEETTITTTPARAAPQANPKPANAQTDRTELKLATHKATATTNANAKAVRHLRSHKSLPTKVQ